MSGLKFKIKRHKHDHFSEAERRMIIEDYLQSGLTKKAIWEKYTGSKTEHGLILYWMHRYGYFSDQTVKSSTFASKMYLMKCEDKNQEQTDFESLQLQKRISDLEKQLSESEMKCIAWQMMIELAEKEFNISIKKKFNIKSSKK
jgi:transposase-like protein